MEITAELATAETRAWLRHAVVGLNLCPFAKAPQVKGLVRVVCSEADEPAALLGELQDEMRRLAEADPDVIETTLLVHPHVLGNFLDYNDFLDVADDALDALGLDGVLQVASFHPDYQFAGTGADDLGNASNRTPYPTLQLLRESSVERALESFADADAIVDANLATLDELGAAGWAGLRARCRADAEREVGSSGGRLPVPSLGN